MEEKLTTLSIQLYTCTEINMTNTWTLFIYLHQLEVKVK